MYCLCITSLCFGLLPFSFIGSLSLYFILLFQFCLPRYYVGKQVIGQDGGYNLSLFLTVPHVANSSALPCPFTDDAHSSSIFGVKLLNLIFPTRTHDSLIENSLSAYSPFFDRNLIITHSCDTGEFTRIIHTRWRYRNSAEIKSFQRLDYESSSQTHSVRLL